MEAPASSSIAPRNAFGALISDELLRRGVVNMVGLDSIRDRVGERWEKVRESVYSRLEAILRRKLRGEDFFARFSDLTYLVAMPAAEREEAQVCCLTVALELHRGLFGSCDLGDLQILAGSPGGGDTIAIEALPADEIRALVRKHGLQVHEGSAVRGENVHALPQPAAAAKGFVFWPMWDVRKEAVIGYRCVPASGNVGSVRAPGSQPKARADLQLVLSALKHASDVLLRHLERGERFFVSVTMTYEMLGCPLTRSEISAACRELSNRLRGYLLFEISEIPRGVPAGRLADLAAAVRPFCKGLILHTPFRDRAFAPHAANVAQAMAFDVPIAANATEVRQEIDRVRHDAQQSGCLSVLSNVAEPEFFRFAVSRGVNLVSGPLLGSMTEPRPMYRLRADEILSRAAADQAPYRAPLRAVG